MLRNVYDGLRQEVRRRLDGRLGQDELRDDGVVSAVAALFLLLEPRNRIVVLRVRSPCRPRGRLGRPSRLDDLDDDAAGLGDLRAQLPARRQEPMHKGAEGGRPQAQQVRGDVRRLRVLGRDSEPGFVARALVAEEDARGEPGDELEDLFSQGDVTPV